MLSIARGDDNLQFKITNPIKIKFSIGFVRLKITQVRCILLLQ